jgi:hypothetical protein
MIEVRGTTYDLDIFDRCSKGLKEGLQESKAILRVVACVVCSGVFQPCCIVVGNSRDVLQNVGRVGCAGFVLFG